MASRMLKGDRAASPKLSAQMDALRGERQSKQNRVVYLDKGGNADSVVERHSLNKQIARLTLEIDKLIEQIKANAQEARYAEVVEAQVHMYAAAASHQQERADVGKIEKQLTANYKQNMRSLGDLKALQQQTSSSTDAARTSIDKTAVMLNPDDDTTPPPTRSLTGTTKNRSLPASDLKKRALEALDESDDLYGEDDDDNDGKGTNVPLAHSTVPAPPGAPAAPAVVDTPIFFFFCMYCKKKMARRQTKQKHEKDTCKKRPTFVKTTPPHNKRKAPNADETVGDGTSRSSNSAAKADAKPKAARAAVKPKGKLTDGVGDIFDSPWVQSDENENN